MLNKKKIVNDPVYGFINIPTDLIFDIIEHPYFQRLRRIKQLGLTYLVYPGAVHNRFQHVLGAMHLMKMALDVIRAKGADITDTEAEGALIAILLHDIGHGPYSHTLEGSFIEEVTHEELSYHYMQKLAKIYEGALTTGMEIFAHRHQKKFLHQLVSSQLDTDRLDYLIRDSFYTGVSEGVIGVDRIIKMLTVVNDELVVEEKGIYSIEKFLIARRLMYWQVYLHKAVVSAELMLHKIIQRAKYLIRNGVSLFGSPALHYFLQRTPSLNKQITDEDTEMFAWLDDMDVMSAIKVWSKANDFTLSYLCNCLINRRLFRIEIQKEPFEPDKIEMLKTEIQKKFGISASELPYYIFTDVLTNNAYSVKTDSINILTNKGELIDIAQASDISNVKSLSKTVIKYYLCYPKLL